MDETWKLEAWTGRDGWATVETCPTFEPAGRDAMTLGRAGFRCRLRAPSGMVTVEWAGIEGMRWRPDDPGCWALVDGPAAA